MNTQTATNSAITPYVINATELEKFGLRQEDESEIQAVAERIDASNPDTVYQFGRDVAENTAAYADSLLEQIRNKDLDDAGSKLTEVVNLARSVNVSNLTESRSNLPVIGPIINKIRTRGKNFAASALSDAYPTCSSTHYSIRYDRVAQSRN